VLTGSAAVAVASGIYRQSSFKASNLGIIAPTKIASRETASGKVGTGSPAVRTVEDASAVGADGATTAPVAGVSSSGVPERPAPLLARKSFKGTDLPTDGSFKSPYMFATPSKPKKASGGADSTDTPTAAAAATIEKEPDDAPAEKPRGAENTSFNLSADFGTTGPLPFSSTTGAPAAGTIGLLGASLTTPVRKSMRGTGSMGNSTTLPGASTTMKSTLTAATTPTKQTTGAMESKSAFAPRRPSNAPSNTDAARSAVRNSRYSISQKNKADAPAGITTPLAQATGSSEVQTPVISTDGGGVNADITGTPKVAANGTSGGDGGSGVKPTAAVAPPAVKDAGSAFKRSSFVRKTSSATPSK
jgi:hypothetical protein